jgi:TolA-binding protein
MSRTVKLALYVVCVLGVVIFGTLTVRAYREASRSSEQREKRLEHISEVEPTNSVPSTNAAVTNEAVITNVLETPDAATNETPSAATNAPATNAAAAAVSAPPAERTPSAGGAGAGYSRMVTRALGLLVSLIGLAILIGYDVSHFLAHRAHEAFFSSDGQPVDPEYEKAEQLWNDGKYLEAVRAMREYLEKNPREQYVALRIAEIYESNLNNPLAAALEYEEVLKKKLPPERWGWAAIHLANIYSGKLDKSDKAIELLRRIDSEYGTTAAAKKARERLLQIDPDFVPATQPETVVEETAEPDQLAEPKADSNLPPGFRPKK